MITPEAIERIRNRRAFNISWEINAREENATIEECRAALGMPVYSQEPSEPAPWKQRQRDLFSQPDRADVSDH